MAAYDAGGRNIPGLAFTWNPPEEGGYDAQFETPLPEDLTCPICMFAFREPIQTECGHQFCKTCIDRSIPCNRPGDVTCPVDREPQDRRKMFPDNNLKRKVLSLKVGCSNVSTNQISGLTEICQWKGELRHLDEHEFTCELALIKCTNFGCFKQVMRKLFDTHVKDLCDFTKCVCNYCHNEVLRGELNQSHQVLCKRWPVSCVNNCGELNVPREAMADHLNVCAVSVLACCFQKYGCNFEGNKAQREDHLKNNVEDHFRVLIEKSNAYEERIEELESKMRSMEQTPSSSRGFYSSGSSRRIGR